MSKKLTAYICGPMTGIPDFNYPEFFAAEKKMKAMGYGVINPARNRPLSRTWHGFMVISRAQVRLANVLVVLDGWEYSEGATEEVMIATKLGIPIIFASQLPKRKAA